MTSDIYPGCFVIRPIWWAIARGQFYVDIHETLNGGISKSGGFKSDAKLWVVVACVTMSYEQFWFVLSDRGDVGWTSISGWTLLGQPHKRIVL